MIVQGAENKKKNGKPRLNRNLSIIEMILKERSERLYYPKTMGSYSETMFSKYIMEHKNSRRL